MRAKYIIHSQSVYPLISMSTAGIDDFVETVVPVTFLQHGEASQAINQSILDGHKAASRVLIVVVLAIAISTSYTVSISIDINVYCRYR